jgi:hypothetical protein
MNNPDDEDEMMMQGGMLIGLSIILAFLWGVVEVLK